MSTLLQRFGLLLLRSVLLSASTGCMLTKSVAKIGRQQEEAQSVPHAVVIGSDGSLALEYDARLWGDEKSVGP